MTVSSEDKRENYNGNGVTLEFAIGFYFLINTDIKVYKLNTVTNVETLLAETTHYTLAGAGEPSGGTLTMLVAPTGDPLETITILRDVTGTQGHDYVELTKFPADSHERALDKLTMLHQQLVEEVGRTLKFKSSSTETDVEITEDLVAGKVVLVNAGGTDLIMGPDADEIESAQTYATAAGVAKTAAETAQTAAELAETNAETAETGAVAAKTAAETAETGAVAAKTAAETAETGAVAAKTAAETAETGAVAAKTSAETAETGAVAAKTAAETAETGAVAAKTAAETAETNAETAETNAETAEINAAASAASIDTGGLFPVHYERKTRLARTAVDTVTLYAGTAINVNDTIFIMDSNTALELNTNATWDTGTALADAARAGHDYYVYACDNSGTLVLLVSANSTIPTGYTADTSRKIGGFHCLCVAVGTIAGHTLTDFTQGDILPQSIWDLIHRPISEPAGMVWSDEAQIWVDIYLASGTGASTVSVNGGTISDTRNWMDFVDDFGAVKKQFLDDIEFQLIAAGSNEETNITGSADPVTTGGHSDTAARRMISNIGCEDCAGVMRQWLRDQSVMYDDSIAVGWYDLPGSKGSLYRAVDTNDVKLSAGGSWLTAADCGSRCRDSIYYRWYTYTHIGGRGWSRKL